MGKEQGFVGLFRNSNFAKFDPKIPRIYKRSQLPSPSGFQSNNPAFCQSPFGFKKDIPSKFYGQEVKTMQMHNLDAGYLAEYEASNARPETQKYKVIHTIQKLMGTNPHTSATKQPILSDFSQRPPLTHEPLCIPGRILNKKKGNGKGYSVGVAGIVADLDYKDVGMFQHFTERDMMSRNAFMFYVKQAYIDDEGRPIIKLSLKNPANSSSK